MSEDSKKHPDKISRYINNLMSSISPLATLDRDLHVNYVNKPFLKAFQCNKNSIIGKNIFSVFKLSKRDKSTFIKNIEASRKRSIQNCEFKLKEKTFGYSIFPFDADFGVILKDISGRKKLERKVARLHSRLLRLQERERQKLASELHDAVGQTILAAKLNFITYGKNPVESREHFDTGLQLIDLASQELREIHTDLYPSSLRELGLEAAVRSFSRGFLKINGIKSRLSFNISDKLSHEIKVNLFRIIQESMTNLVKHSRADRVSLNLKQNDKGLVLKIKDNGIGFIPEEIKLNSSGYGLENIHRRVEDLEGEIIINSRPGAGTTLEIWVPD